MNLSVSSDGLENDRKKDDHSDGLDRTSSFHKQQTRAMLYGAVVANNVEAGSSSAGAGTKVGGHGGEPEF